MQFLENAKIGTKIIAVIVLMAVTAFAGLAYLSLQFNRTDTHYSAVIQHEGTAATLHAHATGGLLRMGFQLGLMLVNDPGSLEFSAAESSYLGDRNLLKDRLQTQAALVPGRSGSVAEMLKAADGFDVLGIRVMALAKAGHLAEANAQMQRAGAEEMKILPLFDHGNDQLTRLTQEAAAKLNADTDHTIFTSIVGIGVALIAVIGFSQFVAGRGITRPIDLLRDRMVLLASGDTARDIVGLSRRDEVGQMAVAMSVFRDNAVERIRLEKEAIQGRSVSQMDTRAREAASETAAADTKAVVDALAFGLHRLSVGDVTYRIDGAFVDRLDDLRLIFNASLGALQGALCSAGDSSRVISSDAEEIRSTAWELARRTEQQTVSLEQALAALERITLTVEDSARRAEQAGLLVDRTRKGAEKSGNIVRKAVAAMTEIDRSSSKISSIIGVIDDLAFQTNLLALNAGVEAARAGEAGKGFAVVAQEVRELAQRSAGAANEIRALIDTSENQVRAGVELVGETGSALAMIETEVVEISALVGAIVTAFRDQATGIGQVNIAVHAMHKSIQQNAEMVERSDAASHRLSDQAASLAELLGRFELGNAAAPVAEHVTAVRRASQASRPVASPARDLIDKVASGMAFGRASAA